LKIINFFSHIENLSLNFINNLGSSYYLKQIPYNINIYNIYKYTRAAGTYSILIKKYNENYIIIQMPSKKYKILHKNIIATLGKNSNIFFKFKKYKKAGNSRNQNKRSHVRGTAQNAIDHPHGGGRGKTSGQNKTFKGKINKGKKNKT